MKAAFAQPGFGRLFAGLTTSAFGDWVMLLVLSMWVKTLTGSNSAAGLTFFFMLVPSLFAPAFGVWIDRRRRKPLLVWGHLLSALIVLPLLFVRSAEQVWVIWTVAFLYGISFVVLPAGLTGLLKELMPEELLVDANASLQTTREALRLGGPLIGAAIFGLVGGWAVALVDAATFLVAAACIAGVVVTEDQPQREETHLWHQVTAGVRHLAGDRVLRHMIIGFGLMLIVIGFTESSIYAVLDGFGKAATFAAVLSTLQGVGAVAGGLLSSRVIHRFGEVATAAGCLLIMAIGLFVVSSTGSLGVMLGAGALIGMAIPPLFVAFNTLVQVRTPQPILGRVSMAVEVFMGTPQAISMAGGSLLVAVLSYRSLFLIMAVVTALGSMHIAVWLREEMRVRPVAVAGDADGIPAGA